MRPVPTAPMSGNPSLIPGSAPAGRSIRLDRSRGIGSRQGGVDGQPLRDRPSGSVGSLSIVAVFGKARAPFFANGTPPASALVGAA